MNTARLFLTVYYDAVRLEIEQGTESQMLGWFRDEVSAISAATEHLLMASAILSCVRKVPPLLVACEYKQEWSKKTVLQFKRATRVKCDPEGRKVVRVPGSFHRPWVLEPMRAHEHVA
jgi:hypothetical protein